MHFQAKLRTILAGSLLCSVAGTGAVMLSGPPASAATAVTLYVAVGGTGDCTTLVNACSSIQAAVTAAQGSTYNGDDVTIDVAAGTYTENVTIAASRLHSLTIAGTSATSTTVNGNAAGSVFSVESGTVTFSGLTVTNGKGGDGGGIFNLSPDTVNVTDSTLSNNTANTGGGGIFNLSPGTVNVTDSTLSNNTSNTGGGGIFNSGRVNVTDSTLSNNTANEGGGGVYNNGTVNVTDSTLFKNSANDGGGIFANIGTVNVIASTLFKNSANDTGGIFSLASVNLDASIIVSGIGVNCGGLSPLIDRGYNLTDDASCGLNSTTDLTVSAVSLNLGALANNGGPTQTLLPLLRSPAIGKIPLNTTINSVQVCPRIDQRGLASASNFPCNIGAVEGQLQTVSFTSSAPSATVGSSYTPTVSSTSGLAVTLTVDASSSSVCSINADGVVSFLTPGTCTLDANQAGDANYAAAPQVQQSVTVSATSGASSGLLAQAPLTLTSTSGVAGTPLTLTSSGGSGTGALSFFLVTPGSASCTLHGDTLGATSAGTCSLLVFKAGDATYLNAISSPTSVTFTSLTPTPSLLTPAPLILTSSRGVVGTSLTLTSKGGSSTGTVSYALTTPGSASCTLNGDTLMAKRAGTCTLNLSEAATSTYAAIFNVATVTFTTRLHALRVEGSVTVGSTTLVTIIGTGFYDKPTIRSNDARTSAVVIHDHGTSLVVRVRVSHGAATGWHDFTVTLANGHSCRVRYLVK